MGGVEEIGAAKVNGQIRIFRNVSASGSSNLMSDDNDDADESATELRAKAAHCMSLAKFMSKDTRMRLIQIASDYLERAVMLEQEQRRKDE